MTHLQEGQPLSIHAPRIRSVFSRLILPKLQWPSCCTWTEDRAPSRNEPCRRLSRGRTSVRLAAWWGGQVGKQSTRGDPMWRKNNGTTPQTSSSPLWPRRQPESSRYPIRKQTRRYSAARAKSSVKIVEDMRSVKPSWHLI